MQQDFSFMEQAKRFFNSRPFKLVLITLGIALVLYLLLMFIFPLINVYDFPPFLHWFFSLLGAGLIVYKFFMGRIF